MFLPILKKALDGKTLSRAEAREALGHVMDGKVTPAQIGALLAALKVRGETFEELVGFAQAMRARATPVRPKRKALLDTCGTGGDGSGTFNISTTVAFVAAGAGAAVAKHGNRSVSSKSGSADVLEALGVKTEVTPRLMARCVEEAGVGFLFAPALHPAMRHAAPVRRELGVRTVFNLLGPLSNPAGARRQLLGVWSPALVPVVARALKELGAERAVVVSSRDGLDELSLGGMNVVARLEKGRVEQTELDARSLGFRRRPLAALRGGSAQDNARITLAVLNGEPGAPREIVALNAAAALMAAGLAQGFADGLERARESIDSGRALGALETLKRLSNG